LLLIRKTAHNIAPSFILLPPRMGETKHGKSILDGMKKGTAQK